MRASNSASITLIGAKTTVRHNCTTGNSGEYGLKVYGASATIRLVSPLTKEQVSLNNGGGGNWGALKGGDINKIKTTPPLNVASNETTTVSCCGVGIFIVAVAVDDGGDGCFSFPLMSTF